MQTMIRVAEGFPLGPVTKIRIQYEGDWAQFKANHPEEQVFLTPKNLEFILLEGFMFYFEP